MITNKTEQEKEKEVITIEKKTDERQDVKEHDD